MKLETTLKLGIGSIVIGAFGLGAWALLPKEAKRSDAVARASVEDEAEADRDVLHASVRRSGEPRSRKSAADSAKADTDDAEGSLMPETDMASIEASEWMEQKYEQAYVYTGTALSKEEQNAKKGIFTEEALRVREDELIRANPDMQEAIEAERAARTAELERYEKSGGLSVEEEAIQKGIQLED